MLKLGATWAEPFTVPRTLRDRLQRLSAGGVIRTWRYATMQPGQPENYYTLALAGHQLLHGPDVPPPTKSCFSAVALARQPHTHALADFLVQTMTSARGAGVSVRNWHRENSLRLEIGGEYLFPDGAFELVTPSNVHTYRFFVELDTGSEPVRSSKERDSLERKLRLYDRYQDACDERFRVLFVLAGRSSVRLANVLTMGRAVIRDPNRTLLCAVPLDDYLDSPAPLTMPLFHDHRGRRLPLVDVSAAEASRAQVQPTAAVC